MMVIFLLGSVAAILAAAALDATNRFDANLSRITCGVVGALFLLMALLAVSVGPTPEGADSSEAQCKSLTEAGASYESVDYDVVSNDEQAGLPTLCIEANMRRQNQAIWLTLTGGILGAVAIRWPAVRTRSGDRAERTPK